MHSVIQQTLIHTTVTGTSSGQLLTGLGLLLTAFAGWVITEYGSKQSVTESKVSLTFQASDLIL